MSNPTAEKKVHRWKTMSPNLAEHPSYAYIDVVRASDYDALKARLESAEHRLGCIAAVTPEDTDVGRYARLYFEESK